MLATIAERWGTEPLTARDRAAASLGDAVALANPRTDDPLSGVLPPVATAAQPNSSKPTKLERIHAALVAALPVRNQQGYYPEETPVPTFASSSDLSDFVRDRTAAWKEHVERQKQRRARRAGLEGGASGGRKHGGRGRVRR